MNNDLQKTKKPFAAMECMIKNIQEEEDDSKISDSDSESESTFLKWNATLSSPLKWIS